MFHFHYHLPLILTLMLAKIVSQDDGATAAEKVGDWDRKVAQGNAKPVDFFL
jgi:hypothetical protein